MLLMPPTEFEGLCLVLLLLVHPCSVDIPEKPALLFLLKGEQRRSEYAGEGSWGKELGGLERGGRTVIRMREE
jgi:hypothetical protein